MFTFSQRSLARSIKHVRHYKTFEQGDFCMLRQVKSNKKFFVGPLEQTGERGVKGGAIAHTNIIGKAPRSVIRTEDGK
jgi:tRNA (adenine57-N1/adenine58-N1)-methyltransferase